MSAVRGLDPEAMSREISQKAYTYDEVSNQWVYDEELAHDLEQDFQAHVTKLNSVAVVYTRADSIITGDNISVGVETNPDMDTTAYNDGKQIMFNASLLENTDDIGITSLHGFNYHEVAHVLYSPRAGSELGKWIMQSKVKRAYNILEDSRIERLIIAKYPSTRLFLETCMTDYALKGDSKEWGDLFILTTGRKYLDIEMRQLIADRFIAQYGLGVAEEVASITHNYRTLVLPNDSDKAKELITRMAKIVGTDDEDSQFSTPEGSHDDRNVQHKGRAEGVKEQGELQKKADGMEQGVLAESLSEQEAKEGEGGNDTGNGSSDTDHHTDGQNADYTPTNEDKALRDKLNQKLEQLASNQQVKSLTSEVRNAIDNNSEQGANAKKALYTNASVKPSNREIAERFGHELERLRIENDPMWRLEVPMGRLNVARSMHSNINDIDRLFDRWDMGNDNRDIEAVVLVDNSGSMMFQMNSTLEAMWAIKRGVEQIDGRVTVFRFNDNTRVVYNANEKASPTEYRSLNSSGGTNPYEALLEADRILTNSDRAIKLLFIISDGEWHNAERCNEIISRMNQVEGMLTVAVFLGDLDQWRKHYSEEQIAESLVRYQHGADMLHVVAEPTDLIDVAIKVVKETMVVAH
jgi:Mg-chelatase subunit ChlD